MIFRGGGGGRTPYHPPLDPHMIFQVDICILDTILMLQEFGLDSGALAAVGEFVQFVTMTRLVLSL